jgi:hypothetical protein
MDSVPVVINEKAFMRLQRLDDEKQRARKICALGRKCGYVHPPITRDEFSIFSRGVIEYLLSGDFRRSLVSFRYNKIWKSKRTNYVSWFSKRGRR